MKICHTAPIKWYIKYPNLFVNNSFITLRTANLNKADADDFVWLQQRNSIKTIVWLDYPLSKTDVSLICASCKASAVIYPVDTPDAVKYLDFQFANVSAKLIVNIMANDFRVFLKTLDKSLQMDNIYGIAIDYKNLLKPFAKFSYPLCSLRPRVISSLDEIYGFSLYNKNFICLNMVGALSELIALRTFKFIESIITNLAISAAKSEINLQSTSLLPTDFDETFITTYSIESDNIENIDKSVSMEIINTNIRIMEEHI